MSKKKSRDVIKKVSITIALALACIATFWTVPTTFDINAHTETVHLKAGSYSRVQWIIANALMYRDFDADGSAISGVFAPSAYADIVFERIGTGPLRIRCKNSLNSVGEIWTNDGQHLRLGNRVSFVFQEFDHWAKAGNTFVAPLIGDIEVGRDLSFDGVEQQAALQAGTVRVLGKSLLGETLFEAGTYSLEFGDDIRISEPLSPTFGLLVGTEQSGLKVSIRCKSKAATVTRFGSTGYKIQTSIYSRLKNDAVLQVLWITCLAFVGIARSLGKENMTAGLLSG